MQCVRAIYRACKLAAAAPPYDNVTLKIWYQGVLDDSHAVVNAGQVPPATDRPLPVVVILPGINVGPEAYSWLAERLASSGCIAVTYSHIAEEMPGYVSLTPGLDIDALRPEYYGKRPSATALAEVFAALAEVNDSGLLAGCLAIDEVIVFGHSAGGSVALFNADQAWFPQIRAAAAYGAHAGASKLLGYDDGAILPLPDSLPLLLMAGTRDGVIASSAHRYGEAAGDPLERVRATFESGITVDNGSSFLLEIDGGNHFSCTWPASAATGRGFLDWEESGDSAAIRDAIASALLAFINFSLRPADDCMQELNNLPAVAALRRR